MPILLKVLVSAVCIAALWIWIEPAGMAARFRQADPGYFAAAFAVHSAVQILNAAKLRAVLPPPRLGLGEILRVNFIATFFSFFVPGGMGGEVARWAWLSRATGSASRALAAVLLDRITGLWAQILLALAGWVWIGRGSMDLWTALAAAAAILSASVWAGTLGYRWFTGLISRLAAWYARRTGRDAIHSADLGEALAELLSHRSRFAKVAALSLANQALTVATLVLVDRTIGGTLSPAQAALFLLGHTMVSQLPVSLGNWGVSEGTMGILYHYSGSESGTGVLISLLMRVLSLPFIGLGWLLFLLQRGQAKRP